MARLLAICCAWGIACSTACTEPAVRTPVRVEIEADKAIRDVVEEVQVVVETEYANSGGWLTALSPRFEPKARGWPLAFGIDRGSARRNYLITATARDERDSIVAEVRALRESQDVEGRGIFLRFEASCLRRPELCPKGDTCHAGNCVDARYEPSRDATEPSEEPPPAQDAGPDPGGPSVATEGEACAPDGARSCTGEGSRTPLECGEGKWHPNTMCADDELCDMTPGARRGTCRQIADECIGQALDVPFCDHEIMHVCSSMFESEMRPCGMNEHCVASGKAQCECMTGFVKAATGCERPRDCRVENGGCDALTTCTMTGSKRTCGVCPAGYVGDGESGCEPLLAGLTPFTGELTPAFDPTVHNYRVNASLLTTRLTLTPFAPSAERVEINGSVVVSGADWTTPPLPLGEYPVKVTLTSKSGAASEYQVIVERSGKQTTYIKASNTGDSDGFGTTLANSGDTLVITALGEDSAATSIDGNQADNSAADAGAVYVFVQRGDHWEQQAYLKTNDTAPGDYFGGALAIEGDTLVASKWMTADPTYQRAPPDRPGAVYVFTRSAAHWAQAARLVSPDAAAGDRFGYSLALSGDTLIIGAPSDGGDGSVFEFTRVNGEWKPHAKLKASQPMAGAAFGYTVAMSSDTLVVTAPFDSRAANRAGAAYVYVRSATGWTLQQRLVPDASSNDANFGYAVSVLGDRVLIGAPRIQSIISALTTTSPGEVFAYERAGGAWTQKQVLKAILPRQNDGFGIAAVLTATTALIGACNDPSGARGIGADASRLDAAYAGSSYLFAMDTTGWKVATYLKSSNADALDSFGIASVIAGDSAIISANWESSKALGINGNADDDSASRSGAVYVFK